MRDQGQEPITLKDPTTPAKPPLPLNTASRASCNIPNVTHERSAHASAPRKVSQPRFRAARSLQYFGCRWQRWQVTYTRSVDTKRRSDLQDTSVVIRHRAKHTVYPSPRPSPLHPCRPLRNHSTHVPDVLVRETRSACHCLARRALDLPQRIEHTPDFLSGRVKRRCGHIFRTRREKEKKSTSPTIRVVPIFVLCRPRRCSNSSASVRARSWVLEEKGNQRDQPPVSHPSPPRSLL